MIILPIAFATVSFRKPLSTLALDRSCGAKRLRGMRHYFLLLIALVGGFGSRAADSGTNDFNAAWLAEHYTKFEYRIPMRDGVRLFTRAYVPKDDSQAWPIILTRTPYALKPYGEANYTDPVGSFRVLAKD